MEYLKSLLHNFVEYGELDNSNYEIDHLYRILENTIHNIEATLK